ncbi:MAG: 7-carboxy-7-deazaguanine synthase QueE [Terricaulis sp.]
MELRLARNDEGAPEIFRSLQGEGPMAGRERTFIRLSGCNLHCVWCDTAYTWNWIGSDFVHERDTKFDPRAEMIKLRVEEAARLVNALPSEGVVITGGEPLMQSDAVAALIDALTCKTIEIETNGSIAPSLNLTERVTLFVVSPKLAHSGNAAEIALKPEPLAAFAALPNAHFKFVAREIEDVASVAPLAARHEIAPERIQIMPEGASSAVLKARAERLAPAIAQYGFTLSDRLHIHLYGAKRGI